jgi:hypothetical protein
MLFPDDLFSSQMLRTALEESTTEEIDAPPPSEEHSAAPTLGRVVSSGTYV